MDIIDLNDEEIDYELQLRNKFDLGFSNRRTKLSALRSLFTEEIRTRKFPESSAHVINVETILTCVYHIQSQQYSYVRRPKSTNYA